jgi:putative tryptophan/tyrosine transport system substrate-binding protein
MRRRQFITLLGGAAAAWPVAAQAQQHRVRRIGVLMGLAETDQFTQGYVRELRDRLHQLGWTDSKVQFTYRYAAGDPGIARAFAKELVEMQPDLIVGHTTSVIAALFQTTRTVPVVFVSISDPVLNGFVASMARPGGNMTGFTNYEFTMGAKWLEVLREIAPKTSRISLLLNPDTGSYYVEYLRSVQTVALSSSIQATLAPVHNADEIETTIKTLAREPGGGLIVLPSAPITAHIDLVIGLASQFRTPAVYPFGSYARQGGLVSYGVELNDLFRRAAEYVDRILKGEKPADLPVQAPTKYELVINLKTAMALGLTVPSTLLARADEVIE